MIGQKGFFKTKSISNAGLGDAIIGGAPMPAPESPSPTTPPENPTQPHFANSPEPHFGAIANNQPITPAPQSANKKLFLAVGISVLATALIGVVIYFVFLAPKDTEGETVPITYSSPDNDGSQTIEETLTEYDQKISDAKSDDEAFGLTLNKAGYYNLTEDYDAAIELLNTIEISSLSDFDQYRVYNYMASAYRGKGNTSEADRYQKLADDANLRDLNSNGE